MYRSLPKVSVITVCYNAGYLLPKTIESVLEQDYDSLEYIIIDGASEDNTKEIVKSYGNKISCFICEPDSGIYDAMNKGISLATGSLILFLNAGDYFISKEVIGFAIARMNQDKADLFFCRFIWVDPRTNGIVLSDHQWVTFSWDLKESNFPHPSTFYKKYLFDKIGKFDMSYKLGADYEWNMRALVKNKIAFQYIDIATTIFFADGVSNQEKYAKQCSDEENRIFNCYLKPKWIYTLGFKHDAPVINRMYFQKILAKVYKLRLNRIYW